MYSHTLPHGHHMFPHKCCYVVFLLHDVIWDTCKLTCEFDVWLIGTYVSSVISLVNKSATCVSTNSHSYHTHTYVLTCGYLCYSHVIHMSSHTNVHVYYYQHVFHMWSSMITSETHLITCIHICVFMWSFRKESNSRRNGWSKIEKWFQWHFGITKSHFLKKNAVST